MQFGIFSVSDVTTDPTTGRTPNDTERVRAMLTMQTPYVQSEHEVPGGEDEHVDGAGGQRPDQPRAQQEEAS